MIRIFWSGEQKELQCSWRERARGQLWVRMQCNASWQLSHLLRNLVSFLRSTQGKRVFLSSGWHGQTGSGNPVLATNGSWARWDGGGAPRRLWPTLGGGMQKVGMEAWVGLVGRTWVWEGRRWRKESHRASAGGPGWYVYRPPTQNRLHGKICWEALDLRRGFLVSEFLSTLTNY